MAFYRHGYICERQGDSKGRLKNESVIYRNVFIVKACGDSCSLSVGKSKVHMPLKFLGRRCKIKIQFVNDTGVVEDE